MNFRRATVADLDLLAEWNFQLIQDEGHENPMGVAELRDRMEGWLSGEFEGTIFDEEGGPIAYALCRPDPRVVYIRHFFVARDKRREGIGREAMRILTDQVYPGAVRVVAEVLMDNFDARGFWRAAGFHEYSVTVLWIREEGESETGDTE